MISSVFHTLFYNPIYNSLVFLIDVIPGGDVGVAIVAVTVFVKLILFPLSKKAVRTQMLMKRIEPELKKIKEQYANDRAKLAQMTMEIYRANKINPFSSVLLILVQIPVIFALYWVFYKGGLPVVDTSILYSFIPNPTEINIMFLNLLDVSGKSIIIAALAGITQYYQVALSLPPLQKRTEQATFKDDLARSFHLQMRYVMPVFVFVFSYALSTAIALYWLTSNIFAIGQELVIRKQVKEKFNA